MFARFSPHRTAVYDSQVSGSRRVRYFESFGVYQNSVFKAFQLTLVRIAELFNKFGKNLTVVCFGVGGDVGADVFSVEICHACFVKLRRQSGKPNASK